MHKLISLVVLLLIGGCATTGESDPVRMPVGDIVGRSPDYVEDVEVGSGLVVPVENPVISILNGEGLVWQPEMFLPWLRLQLGPEATRDTVWIDGSDLVVGPEGPPVQRVYDLLLGYRKGVERARGGR